MLARGNLIEMVDLPDRLLAPRRPGPVALAESLDAVERRHIEQVLADSRTLEEAAARLGIDVTTLWRKRKRYGIE